MLINRKFRAQASRESATLLGGTLAPKWFGLLLVSTKITAPGAHNAFSELVLRQSGRTLLTVTTTIGEKHYTENVYIEVGADPLITLYDMIGMVATEARRAQDQT